jgi:uncharacterized delta-60 repeat protein
VLGLIVSVLALPATPVAASPGDLDPDFAKNGQYRFGGDVYDIEDAPRNGFVLATGGSGADVYALTADGRPLRRFGNGGWTRVPAPPWRERVEFDNAIRIARHGAGWLVSVVEEGRRGMDGWLVRLTSDGDVDPAFGNQGFVELSGVHPRAAYLGVDADNRILTAVIDTGRRDDDDSLSIRRFLPDGSIDTTYGTRGSRVISRDVQAVSGLAISPTGGVTAAYSSAIGSIWVSRLVRLDARGRPQSVFGAQGARPLQVPGLDKPYVADLHQLGDGRLIITGSGQDSRGSTAQFALRLDSSRRIDTSYGTGGYTIVTDPIWSLSQGSTTVDPSGRIYLAAITFRESAMTRLDPSGRIDQQFGGGSVRTPLPGWVSGWRVQNTALVLVTLYPFGSPRHRIVRMFT